MKTFRIGGVHPQDNKQYSAHKQITEVPLPKKAVIPLVQHIGAPLALPLVITRQSVISTPSGSSKSSIRLMNYHQQPFEFLLLENE